jgi:hypothetical protein
MMNDSLLGAPGFPQLCEASKHLLVQRGLAKLKAQGTSDGVFFD